MGNNPKRKIGAIAFALILVASGVIFSAGGAVASMSALSVDGTAITTDDGTVDDVGVSVTVGGTYDGTDKPAETVTFHLQAHDGDQWETLKKKGYSVSDRDSLKAHAGMVQGVGFDVSLTDSSSWKTADFTANTDGKSQQTEVKYRIVMVVEDGNGDTIVRTSSRDTAIYKVNNEATTSKTGGSGGSSLSGTNQAY